MSPRGWQNLFHNAVAVLREISDYELRVRLQDAGFRRPGSLVLHDFEAYLPIKTPGATRTRRSCTKIPVAYFSAEFGFHESLPISAGGLGILAGDHAKSASDLGLGFVGISLFYREGYFQQAIDSNNWQTEFYNLWTRRMCRWNRCWMPGLAVVCAVEIGMSRVSFQAWRVNVGRVPVYLLDTNRPENEQHFRDLTLGFMAATARRASCRRFCWASAGSACCARWAWTPRFPHERGARGVSHPGVDPRENGRREKPSRMRWPPRRRSAFSPRTPRWKPATTVSPWS